MAKIPHVNKVTYTHIIINIHNTIIKYLINQVEISEIRIMTN